MVDKSLVQTLADLVRIPGLSGYEDDVRTYVRDRLDSLGLESTEDRIGNIYVTLRGSGRSSILISAHMDEVGFLVTKRHHDQWVAIPVGHARLLGDGPTSVSIQTESGIAKGKIVRADESAYLVSLHESQQDLSHGVQPGAPVTFDSPLTVGTEELVGKALDNRAGCAVLLEVANRLKDASHSRSVHLVWTVREEYGFTGVIAATETLDPDLGITIDVTPVGEGCSEWEKCGELGKGPVLTVLDGGLLGYPGLLGALQRSSAAANIPIQLEVVGFGASEASRMQWVARGRPAAAVCVPVLNNGTDGETIYVGDLEASATLVAAFVLSAT